MRSEVLQHYAAQRLPRYTSYPPSTRFGSEVTSETYREWLTRAAGRTMSVYLHIPFCRSMCWYCGCHTTVARRDGPIVSYLAALRREIGLVAGALGRMQQVHHVHFGGGTPTILEASQFSGLLESIRAAFELADGAEIAVEIDPRRLSGAMAAALGAAGVSRASLGVQSFDPAVQTAINRIQTFEQTAAAVEHLRRSGVACLNFDLIYGLPQQSVESCLETARQCLSLRPDRFSVFGYAHVPSFKKHQRKIADALLPDARARHDQAESIAQLLQTAGYRRIGLDHYALPTDEMARAQAEGVLRRNFQGYTTDRCEALLGLGASAIGRLPWGYVQNETVLGRYAERLARGELPITRGYRLTEEDQTRAELIERLMCDFRVDVGRVCRKRWASDGIWAGALPALQKLSADGLIKIEGTIVAVEPEARSLVRTVAAAFDAHLATTGRTHSPTV
jgi:oxygen-independent coproporphyrinogen III oxidase